MSATKGETNTATALTVIRELSGQENTFTVPRLYAQFMGNIEGGLFLNQLIFWSDKGRRGDGFIYKSRPEWQEEILLSDYALRKATKKLKGMGVLETKLLRANGAPTLHYRLDLDKLLNALARFANSANGIVEINESESLESTDGIVEIDESDSLKSTNHRIVDFNESRTKEHHNTTQQSGGGDGLALLSDFGINLNKKVRQLAARYGIPQIEHAIERAHQANVRNKQGLVVSFMESDNMPLPPVPKTCATPLEPDQEPEVESADPELVEARRIWQTVLSDLELQMTRETFNTWLKPTQAIGRENGRLYVVVENGYVQDWLSHRLMTTIQRSLDSVIGKPAAVRFVPKDAWRLWQEALDALQEQLPKDLTLEPIQAIKLDGGVLQIAVDSAETRARLGDYRQAFEDAVSRINEGVKCVEWVVKNDPPSSTVAELLGDGKS